jgi:hypothetical protein
MRLPYYARFMEYRRGVVVWSGGVLAAALSVAILVASRVRVPLWRDPWFILSAIVAGTAFLLLVVSGTPDLAGWLRRQARMVPSVVITSPEADQRVPQKVTARRQQASRPPG